MRLHFKLSANQQPVPFNYQHYLIGAFHKWIGPNNVHDDISLYSMSWLKGGKTLNDSLHFAGGAQWFISCWEEELAKRIIDGAIKDPAVCCGMEINEIQMQEDPLFNLRERFITASPVLVKKYIQNMRAPKHLLFSDLESDGLMTETLTRKLAKAGLASRAKITFDRTYTAAKTRLINLNGVNNRANVCPVIVEGDPEAVRFSWNVGIGHSTGSCFGAVN